MPKPGGSVSDKDRITRCGPRGQGRREPAPAGFRVSGPPMPHRGLRSRQGEGAMRIDFELSGGGTVYLLRPVSLAAHDWVQDHLPADATWFGGAIVVEHRYIGPLIGGAIGDGLVVQ